MGGTTNGSGETEGSGQWGWKVGNADFLETRPGGGLATGPGALRSRRDERRRGAQRAEPQHARGERPRQLAGLRAGGGRAARRPAQRPRPQRPRGLDAHQRPAQPGDVLAAAHSEGDPIRNPRPGQGSPPHALGADRLRDAVHLLAQVPQHLPGGAVPPHQLLHQVRPRALRDQHGLPAQRPPAQAAPVPRRAALRHQQVLSPTPTAPRGWAPQLLRAGLPTRVLATFLHLLRAPRWAFSSCCFAGGA